MSVIINKTYQYITVIPAKAGIQQSADQARYECWAGLDSCFRRNDIFLKMKMLSQERLKTYGLDDAPEALIIARYKWNLALSGALYPSIALLEIGLRNRMDSALTKLYGHQWLDEDWPYWIRMSNHGLRVGLVSNGVEKQPRRDGLGQKSFQRERLR